MALFWSALSTRQTLKPLMPPRDMRWTTTSTEANQECLGLPDDVLRVMFLYLGRRGALSRFTLDLAQAARADPRLSASICVSKQNESFELFQDIGSALFPVDTFNADHGAVSMSWRLPLLMRRLGGRMRQDRTQVVVDLMPHVWSPVLAAGIQRAGVRYVPIIHDGIAHPGDKTGWVKGWTDRTLPHADLVLTLSEFAAKQLVASRVIAGDKIASLFLPDLVHGAPMLPQAPTPTRPMRLLFLGRILPYKGLDLFLDAAALLRAEGVPIEVGVYGEGNITPYAKKLADLKADVLNKWLNEDEIGKVLQRFDAAVLSHIEASQSGVAAAAFGSHMPVVTTPLGGLVEQVQDGVTGVIAERTDAVSLAAAIRRLTSNPELYQSICRNIAATSDRRSMGRFVREVTKLVRPLASENSSR
jgi:glycosyltransferase involved in cell wall biosynthesis